MIEQIMMYRTRDGEVHHSEYSALIHEQRLDEREAGDKILADGGTLYDACVAAGYGKVDDVLKSFTRSDKLIIAHWQCHDDPAYSVCSFERQGIFCHGVTNSFGGYGSHITAADLARYAAHTLEVRIRNGEAA